MTSAPILITGASRGIGRGSALALAAAGFDLVLWGRDGADLDTTAAACRENGVHAATAQVDLADPASVDAAGRRSLAEHPALRGLVVNAGMGVWGRLESVSVSDWRAQHGVNLDGAFFALRASVSRLRACPGAQVVAIASDSSLFGFAERSAYCASKHGLIGLMESARRELRPDGVRVTNLLASRVDTHFRGKQPGSRPEALTADEMGAIVASVFALPPKVEMREIRLSAIGTTFGPFPEQAAWEAAE
jgi:NAD(P)-dependent dehydrogenase (short-subunit alcohol dehydrogenase family)